MVANHWSRTLEIERQGAQVLDAIFGPEFIIVHATKHHQKQKVDRFLIYRKRVQVHIVDYKVDERAATSNNLVLEHVSVERRGQIKARGWLFTTPADWLVFYVSGFDTAYVLLTQRVRDAWADIIRLFPAKETTTPAEHGYSYSGYVTRFVPVPIAWLRQHHLIHRELSAVGAQLRLPLTKEKMTISGPAERPK
jgi:hypothetical protein